MYTLVMILLADDTSVFQYFFYFPSLRLALLLPRADRLQFGLIRWGRYGLMFSDPAVCVFHVFVCIQSSTTVMLDTLQGDLRCRCVASCIMPVLG